MTLGQIIEFTDGIKPNAFQPEDKTAWLNELERLIQTDVLRITEGFTDHVWSATWKGSGLSVPDRQTIEVAGRLEARVGGTVDVEDLTIAPANEGKSGQVLAVVWEDGKTRITLPENTFPATASGFTGAGTLYYSGYTEPMLAPEIWEKIYYTYLEARICAAAGEWSEYANALQLYNAFMEEYVRWYCRHYIDD